VSLRQLLDSLVLFANRFSMRAIGRHCGNLIIGCALVFVVHQSNATQSTASKITLSDHCPPSFELKNGACFLKNQYRTYSSLNNAGVGGLKTGLPKIREGFSPREIDLGRYLFFDPLLSANQRMSCSTCHDPDKGFGDGKPRSRGITGQEVSRNTPSLWNVGFLSRLFFDTRANSLEMQMQGPLFDPLEMANSPKQLLASINGNTTYRKLFAQAFKDAADGVRLEHVYRAIAAFQASLVSLNSRYDLYAHGVADALTKNELAGLNVFRSFVARCAECHTPPLFTNQQIAVIGAPEPSGRALDPGAGAILGDKKLRAGFKVPSLRNVTLTAPYMHAGQFASLRETVEFYNKGRGHAVPKGEQLTLHWHIWEPKLSAQELDRLVDFMHALTDESFKPQRPDALPSGLPLQ
jgi:cytochrome c peroxidase